MFADGNLVQVDGGPNTANFSHPEVTLALGTRALYFSTANAQGKFVVVTNLRRPRAPEIPTLSGVGAAVLLLALLASAALFLVRARS